MPNSRLVLSYLDYQGKSSPAKFEGEEITGANYVAMSQKMADLVAAVEGVTDGLLKKQMRVAYEIENAGIASAAATAQRVNKWYVIFHYAGTTIDNLRMEIPCPIFSLQDPNNRGHWLATDPAWTAFKAAFEAFQSDGDGHFAVIDDVVLVGRNI